MTTAVTGINPCYGRFFVPMPIPNQQMKTEAQRGLDWRREFGRGGTEVGIARARDIANGANLSIDTVSRMASFFARHEVDKEAQGFRQGEDGYPSNGRIAWALWGGDAGWSWARGILRTEDNKTMQDTKSLDKVQALLQLAQAELRDTMEEEHDDSEEPEQEQEADAMPMPEMPEMAIMAKVYTSPTAELKLVSEDDQYAYVEGYGVVFGGVDLTGDTFTAETDYKLARAIGAAVYIDHTLDTEIKIGGSLILLKGVDAEIGEIETITPDNVGLYMRLKLMKASQYWAMVSAMLGTKRCGLSTGSVGHLVRRQGGNMKAWPIVETSLTLTPAEPRTANVQLKSDLTAEPEAQPEASLSGLVVLRDEADSVETIKTKENNMTTNDDAIKALNEQIVAQGERLDQVLKALEGNGRAKDAGIIAPDDEGSKPNVKSFGDFLIAVKNQNRGRLAKVYHAIKDMDADVGGTGAFLIPEEYGSRLLQFNPVTSPLRTAVQVINAQTATGRYPVLDQFITPTAGSGQTAMAAGMVVTTAGPGTTLSETQPNFEQLQWNLKKRGAYVQVDNELVDDSPIVIEQLLTSLARVTITARAERDIIRGSGAGEPLGFLTSSAAVAVSPDTNNVFAYADALEMVSRFKSVGGQGMWLIHPSMWTDIGVFEVSAGSGGVFQANLGGSLGQNLLGFPIVQSEHMPQANSSGCVALIDPTAYLWFSKGDLTVSYSDQAFFTTDQVGWRFTERADGMPWLRNPITLADPQGSFTQSPFVYFND